MKKFILIAGPCAIEDEDTPLMIAEYVKSLSIKYDVDYIFKSSFKKANRTSLNSFMGIKTERALEILQSIKLKYSLPILTDIHETTDVNMVSGIVDVLQIPAFLCRQTELLLEAGRSGLTVNIKKGQFASPESMKFAYEKILSTGNDKVMLTERGVSFGYNNLIVDFTSIPKMKEYCPTVIMDATHCLQQPNKTTGVTGGDPSMIATMCKAATAVGVDGLFIETHPDPSKASSDAASMLQMDKLEEILSKCMEIRSVINE